MADIKFSALPVASSISGTELVAVVQGGVSKQATAALVRSNPPLVVTVGFTFAQTTHANRRINYNSSSPGNATFDGTAAFTLDDGFRLMQDGAGAVTLVASGVTFTNPRGFSLVTAGPGTYIDAEWDPTIGQLVITATGASSGGTAYVKVLNQQFPAITCPISQTSYCLAAIPLPILKAGTKIDVDLRFTLTGAGTKTIYAYVSATASTPGATGVVGTAVHIVSPTTQVFLHWKSGFQNMNSVSIQQGPADAILGDFGQSSIAPRTAAINTGVAAFVNVYCDTVATDTIRLDAVTTTGTDITGL
jgi:hypothetical protein